MPDFWQTSTGSAPCKETVLRPSGSEHCGEISHMRQVKGWISDCATSEDRSWLCFKPGVGFQPQNLSGCQLLGHTKVCGALRSQSMNGCNYNSSCSYRDMPMTILLSPLGSRSSTHVTVCERKLSNLPNTPLFSQSQTAACRLRMILLVH